MKKRPNLRKEILKRFRYYFKNEGNPWINGGAIERFALELGFKGSTAGRILRKMSEEKNGIEKILNKKDIKTEHSRVSSIWYQYIPSRNEELGLRMKNI